MSCPELRPELDLPELMKTLPVSLSSDFCYTRIFDVDFTARLIREVSLDN